MNSNTKVAVCFAVLLASIFFLSTIVIEQNQRNLTLLTLSDDAWAKQKIAETFPDFPVLSYLGDVGNTTEDIGEELRYTTHMGQVVEWKSGQHPEYFRWFTVSQREPDPVQWDLTNHYHVGFITSDLEIHDLGLDFGFQ